MSAAAGFGVSHMLQNAACEALISVQAAHAQLRDRSRPGGAAGGVPLLLAAGAASAGTGARAGDAGGGARGLGAARLAFLR